MDKHEYVNTISTDAWAEKIYELAKADFYRLWNCGNVMGDALEEFNNDVFDYFVQQGEESGQIKAD